MLSNKTKVNYTGIDNDDVIVRRFDDGKTIIIVNVKEAPESKKPVYLVDKLENTYIRTGDGDRKATKEQIASLMRNSQPNQDNLLLDNLALDDLDMDSVIAFKEKVNKRYPNKKYLEMSNEKFLMEIGAGIKDRSSGEFKLKKGTLLFL